MSSVAIIDDNDPAVQYSDGWTLDQTYPYAMGLTRHGAPAGSDLTATVKFHGTSITVFGIISGPGVDHSNYTTPAAGFVLDGGTSGVFNGYKLSSLIDTIYNQTLFSQDGLALQDHELTIARVQGNTPIILWLDYFLVGGQPLSSSSTGSGVTAAPSSRTSSTSTSSEAPDHGTSLSSSSIPTSTASSSSAPSDSTWFSSVFASTGRASASSVTSTAFTSQTVVVVSTPSSSTSRSTSTSTAPATPFATSSATHTPAIIGGCVGASLLVILVAVLACILQRRRRRMRSDDRGPAIEPYVPVPRRAPSPSRAPPSPTKASMRPLSTAAGTIHTSAPSAAPSVPPVPPEKSEQRNDPPSGSRRAGPGHPRATPGSHGPLSLPMATRADTPSAADSFPESDTPLILPTEIGQALAYAPPEVQSNVLSLFRALFLRSSGPPNHRRPEGTGGLHLHAEVDSGLRMYDDAYVPPPEYTTH